VEPRQGIPVAATKDSFLESQARLAGKFLQVVPMGARSRMKLAFRTLEPSPFFCR